MTVISIFNQQQLPRLARRLRQLGREVKRSSRESGSFSVRVFVHVSRLSLFLFVLATASVSGADGEKTRRTRKDTGLDGIG